ncbi:MAG: hypothetical protein GXY33_14235 [Phycisphaerae bacterium]|nr:hypothetical protein [Phycisphaerae bacterium]
MRTRPRENETATMWCWDCRREMTFHWMELIGRTALRCKRCNSVNIERLPTLESVAPAEGSSAVVCS